MSEPTTVRDDEIEIDLKALFGLVLHWLWLILLCGIIGAVIGGCICKFTKTPLYQSTTSVYILNKSEDKQMTYSDTQLASQLTKDYEALIVSRAVLEEVKNQLGMLESANAIKNRVAVSNTTGTRILMISVKHPSPQMAQTLANTIREVAGEKIKGVMAIEAVNLVDEANLPIVPVEPSMKKYIMLGFLAAAFLCGGVIVILFLMDDTIKSSEDIEKYLGLSTLALIPDQEIERKRKSKHRHSSHEIDTMNIPEDDGIEVVELDQK